MEMEIGIESGMLMKVKRNLGIMRVSVQGV
jgi:hypothetical protein